MKGKWDFPPGDLGGSLREADIYIEQERRRAEQKGRFTGFSASLGSRSSKPEVQHTLPQRRLSVPLRKFEIPLLGGLLLTSIEVDLVMDICIKPLEGWKTSEMIGFTQLKGTHQELQVQNLDYAISHDPFLQSLPFFIQVLASGRYPSSSGMAKLVAIQHLHSCNQNLSSEDSWKSFCKMHFLGLDPNQFAYGSVLSACTALGSLLYGKLVYSLALKNGFFSKGHFHDQQKLETFRDLKDSVVCYGKYSHGDTEIEKREHESDLEINSYKDRRKGFVPDPGSSSLMRPEIHNESRIPNASTTGPVVPSNSNDCLIQSEEQVPVPGITMFATDLQLCLEGNTVTRTILRIAFPVLTTVSGVVPMIVPRTNERLDEAAESKKEVGISRRAHPFSLQSRTSDFRKSSTLTLDDLFQYEGLARASDSISIKENTLEFVNLLSCLDSGNNVNSGEVTKIDYNNYFYRTHAINMIALMIQEDDDYTLKVFVLRQSNIESCQRKFDGTSSCKIFCLAGISMVVPSVSWLKRVHILIKGCTLNLQGRLFTYEQLYQMEHPLRIRAFCAEVHFGMWRRNEIRRYYHVNADLYVNRILDHFRWSNFNGQSKRIQWLFEMTFMDEFGRELKRIQVVAYEFDHASKYLEAEQIETFSKSAVDRFCPKTLERKLLVALTSQEFTICFINNNVQFRKNEVGWSEEDFETSSGSQSSESDFSSFSPDELLQLIGDASVMGKGNFDMIGGAIALTWDSQQYVITKLGSYNKKSPMGLNLFDRNSHLSWTYARDHCRPLSEKKQNRVNQVLNKARDDAESSAQKNSLERQEGKPHKEEKPQSLYENLEDSFATKAAEEICLQQKELRVFEISGLVLLNENIQKINPNEPLKEECTTLDEVSWLENHRNVSAIKRSDSPIESDRIMKLPVEVLEGAEKPAEEYENNKELIIEKERDIKEFPAVSIEVESVK
ncbi:hypothetical protein CK203_014698 [Vitis vinifera]|uniref:Uncharacterized protein n=1 Tax=Vitis vinifera TaxID=29760 RepID=A0A438JG49_VITVI|nr:hypothetical protein CK203_014698 [Vitis vinifera]